MAGLPALRAKSSNELFGMNTFGVDSFTGRLSSVMQGTTETTLYAVVVYFGAVSIRKTRYVITA
ncbi:MAG: hypothetical protein IH947_15325 [Bacteroidetes bacterium]|nr:hypothetical protein [Bacteroidota bacterium]